MTPQDLPLEQYRAELTSYAYRMLGSAFDAEDAVQETLLRAWRAYHTFEGRATLRSWLYRIARNVCLDMLAGPQRRPLSMELGAATEGEAWVEPIFPDTSVVSPGGDPAEAAIARETVRQALMVALQHLPPRQRSVLLLRDVLRWRASEVAELLGTTIASVNSALQRARATLAASPDGLGVTGPMDREREALLARYTHAFDRDDVRSLTALLHDDAHRSEPSRRQLHMSPSAKVAVTIRRSRAGEPTNRRSRAGRVDRTSRPGSRTFAMSGHAVPSSMTRVVDGPKMGGCGELSRRTTATDRGRAADRPS